MDSLERTHPDIAKLIEELDAAGLQKAALQISKQALALNHVHRVEVDELIERAKSGGLSGSDLAQLTSLAASTEKSYLEAQGRDKDIESNPELVAGFKEARALNSLAAANNNPTDSIYEALHAGVSKESIKQVLESAK